MDDSVGLLVDVFPQHHYSGIIIGHTPSCSTHGSDAIFAMMMNGSLVNLRVSQRDIVILKNWQLN
jgi:hypothetical protein